ncbi:hypothetical protein CYMTET_41778 [Cymbomonas tetramitiformis]|uniref:Uncharacterized protein n=1 Tax=Cymbomonas tetramitiformis TaxID=36881 RepID=A0AAE0C6S6_9CHLO|nr:hypothetical protein CYMTET_41778 [Cymbomonas tetramitiformis]
MLAENLDMQVHINQNHPDDLLLDMQRTSGRVDSLQQTEIEEADLADHFEEILIANDLVDLAMAETFDE